LMAPWREHDLWQSLGKAEAAARERPATSKLSLLRCLIVQDIDVLAPFWESLFRGVGIEVVACRSYRQAQLELHHGWHLIFLQAPQSEDVSDKSIMQRFQAELKAKHVKPAIKNSVLVYLGEVSDELKLDRSALTGYLDAKLPLPFSVEELRSLLNRWAAIIFD